MVGSAVTALPAEQVQELYARLRDSIGSDHSAEVDPDRHAAFVTALVLHFRHGVSIPRTFREVRVLVAEQQRTTAPARSA